jgi:tRNA modification GTPase
MDTIFALASAPGKAGVSVVRVSGSEATKACHAICDTVPRPRRATLRRLQDSTGGFIDQAVVLFFPAPGSFTGEDVVEFQCHGSVAVVRSLVTRLGEIDGLRLALPGEFTRRALENGRMDLTQVEALSDLIEAETDAQRQQALRNFSGVLSERVGEWRGKLVRAAALLEAVIDFADEDVPEDVRPDVSELVRSVRADMESELKGSHAAERLRSGFEVAIVGPPNSGKSTLLNRLAGRKAAITSEIAGTTRDVIEVRMDIAGLAVSVLDTAGLRETSDEVEALGIEMARVRALEADLRVHLLEDGEVPLVSPREGDIYRAPKRDSGGANGISGLTGEGVEQLIGDIAQELQSREPAASLMNRERHRVAMEASVISLHATEELLCKGSVVYELASQELRMALRAVERLLGRVDVEDILDDVFSTFCLGK